ncbi:MAG TPA: hypothetical protein VFK04_01985 [Gemmatimonadaceae bacterium]|nr:hypothetical protein [Gemmatimonadaceae bacterium]
MATRGGEHPASAESVTSPTVGLRVAVALAVGVVAGLVAFAVQSRPDAAPDFIYPWQAARLLIHGINPYTALPGGLAAPFEAPLLYPLPAVLAAVPFAWLALPSAVGIFIGLSVFLLAYAVTSRNWNLMPFFASAPLILAVVLGQWSPLLVAAALVPAGGFLAIAKPNIGLALTVYRPTRMGVLGSAVFFAASLLLLPTWPRDWLHSLILDRQSGTHVAPITTPLGLILTLALLRWRRPEARLLIAMSCVPQLFFFYDQLPLMLVPSSRRESYAVIIPSSLAFLVWLIVGHGSVSGPQVAEWCVMLSIYLPCLIMVLRRPNEGTVPEWMERVAARLRELFRRSPARAT